MLCCVTVVARDSLDVLRACSRGDCAADDDIWMHRRGWRSRFRYGVEQ